MAWAIAVGLFAQVFLVDDAVFANDEGHDAGISVIRRIRQGGKPAGHLSVYDVILRAAFGFVSLFGEEPVVVAIEWLRFITCVGIAGSLGKVTNLFKWAWGLARGDGPVQPVLLAFIADKFLRVLFCLVALRIWLKY